MYDKALVLEILNRLHETARTIQRRFEPVHVPLPYPWGWGKGMGRIGRLKVMRQIREGKEKTTPWEEVKARQGKNPLNLQYEIAFADEQRRFESL